MTPLLTGIVRAPEHQAPLEVLERVAVTVETGIEGDCRGSKPGHQISILFREAWADACRDAGAEFPWTTRRANLLVEGLDWPREAGGRIAIGEVVLEVTQETKPCSLMEAAFPGLRAAMRPEWRGGVLCRVIQGGEIMLGDEVALRTTVVDSV